MKAAWRITLAAATVGVTVAAARPVAPVGNAAVIDPSGTPFSTAFQCGSVTCCGFADSGHQMALTPQGTKTYHAGECSAPSCALVEHPGCSLASEQVKSIWYATVRGDSEALRKAAEEHPKFVRINTERSAVQLLNCTGEFVAHFPIQEGVLRALEE